ncbi:MAG: RlpA-like double-psi beta-barrel domain-containing protein [Patescibacteria group bacterium]|nr:RlpA-like double-psi beta-barrel domain-containing protein [Patescibacteria group bacterium]
MSRKISLLIFLSFLTAFLPCGISAEEITTANTWAVKENIINYDAATIFAGVLATLAITTDPTLNFSLQIPAQKFSAETKVTLCELYAQNYPSGPVVNEKKNPIKGELFSPVFEFDILSAETSTTSPILIFERKRLDPVPTTSQFDLVTGLAPGVTNMQRRVIHYFDKNLGAWRPLKTIRDLKNDTWSAEIPFRYALVAFFVLSNEFEAYASWYPDSLTPSSKWNCASNRFPIGSKIEVCRLDKSEKCVTIKVVSRGPYVDNRIVDLTHSAFNALGSSSSGLFQVLARLAPENSKIIGPNSSNLLAAAEFSANLKYGLTNNPDVKRLQEFLIDKGYLESGFNTGNYYGLTRDAIKKFQTDHSITPINGQFGSKTRGAVNREVQ